MSLHRYPVKSLLGEHVAELELDERGVRGDRIWSVRTSDNKIGSGKTTRRFAAVTGLLRLRASWEGQRVRITLPDGSTCVANEPEAADLLSDVLGQQVSLARETDVSHFDDGPVSMIGVTSVAAVSAHTGADIDVDRFRANVVVDGLAPFTEDGFVGRVVRIGDVHLEVTMRSPRCVMIDMETADLPEQRGNLVAVGRLNNACLGVIARVVRPGRIRVGDGVAAVARTS